MLCCDVCVGWPKDLDLETLREVSVQVAREAGDLARTVRDEAVTDGSVDTKSTETDVVTAGDRAVERLDPKERALVTLFYYEGRSVGECAAITELSEGNVKVRLHRIRKKLYVLVNDEMNGTE